MQYLQFFETIIANGRDGLFLVVQYFLFFANCNRKCYDVVGSALPTCFYANFSMTWQECLHYLSSII